MSSRRILPLMRRGGRSGGSAPDFSPASIPGLHRWWDPSAGVTLVGSNVSDWVDRVAADNASQATAASRPAQPAALPVFNNRLGLVYDGNDYLRGTVSLNQECSVFTVCECTGPTDGPLACTTTPGAVNSAWSIIYDGFQFYFRRSGTLGLGDAVSVFPVNTLAILGFSATATRGDGYINQASPTVTNLTNVGIVGAATVIDIGSLGGLTYNLVGSEADVIIYNRALAQSEAAQVMRWLGTRYGQVIAP